MARVTVDILGISELKWTGMGEFNSDDHYIYYCGQESLRRNGVAIMVNKRVGNAVLGCNLKNGCSLKNDRMISVRFQGKAFNITVIQVYAPTSNTEEAEVKWFYEGLQDLLELTPKYWLTQLKYISYNWVWPHDWILANATQVEVMWTTSGSKLLKASIPFIREGNGNPLQYSCLENPMGGGAW